MGWDIHFYVEKQVDGAWQSADQWTPNEYAGDEGEPPLTIRYEDRFYTSRNYNLFGILANVRNGRGFAGCNIGDGDLPPNSGPGVMRVRGRGSARRRPGGAERPPA